MVSPIWKAAAEGDHTKIKELLKDATSVDIEIKDHTGVTPLIQAIKNGHIEVVKELLAHGADPTNASSQGRPDTYTQDPAILECLSAARPTSTINGQITPAATGPSTPYENVDGGFVNDAMMGTPAQYDPRGYYYPPPIDGMYPQYAYMPPPEGMHMQGYYPMQPPQSQPRTDRADGAGMPNLPPADIARNIPCRFFPMCKYGPACIFAHPQSPYFNGPPPPAHYSSPYESHPQQPPFPPAGYYHVPPHSFQPPPSNQGAPNGTPVSASHPASSSLPSPLAPPFTPSGPPPPLQNVPYGVPSYPSGLPHSAPPTQHHIPISPTASFHQPAVMNGQAFPPLSPTHHRRESGAPYPPHAQAHPAIPVNGFDDSEHIKNAQSSPEESVIPQGRDGGYRARGSFRRPSFNKSKQPCLFFPAGKCRNGDACRFPHIRPEEDPEAFGPQGFPPNNFPSRFPRNRGPGQFGPIQEKYPSRRDHSSSPPNLANGHAQTNGVVNGNGKPSDYPRGPPRGSYQANGRPERANRGGNSPNPKQRVPSADEFPVLSGSTTPTATVNGFHHGPTAAQVLKGGVSSKDVMKGVTDKLEEDMARVSLTDKDPSKSPSEHGADMPPPVFATIGAPNPKLQIAAA